MMSAKSAATIERRARSASGSIVSFSSVDASCIASPTNRSRVIEHRVLRQPVRERVAQEERRREVLDLAGREQQRPLAVDRELEPREKPRVVARRGRCVVLAHVAELVADAERRAFEDRLLRHGDLRYGSRRIRPPDRLGERLDDDLVDVHVRRAREREHDAVGDVLGRQRIDALVDRGAPCPRRP